MITINNISKKYGRTVVLNVDSIEIFKGNMNEIAIIKKK